jgi:pimeloyl-ACP methyl ester carboxylesterase
MARHYVAIRQFPISADFRPRCGRLVLKCPTSADNRGVTALGLGVYTTLKTVHPHGVRPFEIAVPEEHLLDLGRRLVETRWPEPATVPDWSQGVPLHDLQQLCKYWRTEYDWRATEHRLNRWPQHLIDIDGLTIHYFHLPSPSPSAVPLLLTHGWPGSFFEFEQAMERLADSDFDLVVPSLPGYGFSGKPAAQGWGVHRIAQAWAELMQRLGYSRFIACGSDWGTSISTSLALHYPDRLLGLHLIPPLVPLSPAGGQAPTLQERTAAQDSIDVPTGCTIFPREVPRPSRRLAERRFRNILHWGEPAHGGHFGAWEQPDLFVREVQAVRQAVTQPVS